MLQRILITQIKGIGNIIYTNEVRRMFAHGLGVGIFLIAFLYMTKATPEPVPTQEQTPVPIAAQKKTKKDPFAEAYIKRFAKVAIAEQKKFGIPASIKLAQGLLESNAGKSRLCTMYNNHFGIKCYSKTCKKGHCSNYSDDSHKDFFRTYETAWESWRHHSQFLQGDRYKHLQALGTDDYKGWAKGLKKAGYATDKNYDKKLIDIIELYGLNQ